MQFIILKEGDKVVFADDYFDHPNKEPGRGKEMIIFRKSKDTWYTQQPGKKVKRPIHRNFLIPAEFKE